MVYKQKFTESEVIEILQESPKTTYELVKSLHSSKVTTLKLLSILEKNNTVTKRNRGSPDRPIWEYYLLNAPTVEKKKIKLSNILHSHKK